MAQAFWITQSAAAAMQAALATQVDAGTAAVINIYNSTVPTNADTALGSQTLLAQLTCSTTCFTATSTANPSVLTAGAISSDTNADATGTATFFRLLTQSGGTVVAQGSVDTSAADLVLNTTAITAGSTVAITSMTISLPTG